MKKLLVVLILAAVVMTSGCTVTETAGQSYRRIADAQELQMRMMVEDIQYVLLLEKPQMTSPWAVRSGLPN